MSMRPMPCLRARVLAVRKMEVGSVASFCDLDVSLTGRPFSNSMITSSGSFGAEVMGSAVSFHISVGGVVSGSSRIPAS